MIGKLELTTRKSPLGANLAGCEVVGVYVLSGFGFGVDFRLGLANRRNASDEVVD